MNGAGEAPREAAIVIHDVGAGTWRACDAMRTALRRIAPSAAVTLLVVPHLHRAADDAAFERWVGAARAAGDEIALHGYTHLDEGASRGLADRWLRHVYTAGEGEFAALSETEASRRIAAGLAWLRARGWHADGFVAPAWLLSPGSWQALRASPFRYTCTLDRITALPSGRSLRCRSVVYSTRAAWRRWLSNRWNGWVAARQRPDPLMRFELHPPDFAHRSTRDSAMRLLGEALRTRAPVTLSHVAARLH